MNISQKAGNRIHARYFSTKTLNRILSSRFETEALETMLDHVDEKQGAFAIYLDPYS